MKRLALASIVALIVAVLVPLPHAEQARLAAGSSDTVAPGMTVLLPTNHPRISREPAEMWLAPPRGAIARSGPASALPAAVKFVLAGEYYKAATALPPLTSQEGALGDYARYYMGVTALRQGRASEARQIFRALVDQKPIGYVSQAAAIGEAEAAEALNDFNSAVSIYERLAKGKALALEDVVMRLGRAARSAGDSTKAAEAFARVYYEFALSDLARLAGSELASLPALQAIAPGNQRFRLELGRAERLFGARQYAEARAGFEALRPTATGDDRELVQLRLAECDFFLKRARIARDTLRPFTDGASRQGEALYFYGVTLRDLGDEAGYIRTLQRVADEFPTQTWADDALDNLAQYYVRKDQDDKADETFRELYQRYPKGAHAERAAWKLGWRAYRQERYTNTIAVFERAASDFPRSDYRPAWLYWSARAHENVNEPDLATRRLGLVVVDYLNTYYGRLAAKRLSGRAAPASIGANAEGGEESPQLAALPANGAVVRTLLAVGLFDEALNELHFAQRAWGDSAPIQATVAWIHQQQSKSESGVRRFQLLRGAITTMRRAYPQFMTAGGDTLPRDVLTVIYPIAYWDLIKRNAEERALDPYFVAALVAQESTFVADIKSPANAYGLMQLMPATARSYARRLGIRYSTRTLTDPESNIKMGTAYLADKIKEFGELHLALASYNAGETPVRRWQSERQGMDREEFIDDIPYPETQGYVKRILGTSDDYRRLYAAETHVEEMTTTAKPAAIIASPARPKATPKKASSKRSTTRSIYRASSR